MGASSTGGGTTRGRGGLDMAAWTRLSLGILRQVDGDEDLAPLVLAMAVSDGGAHDLAQVERSDGELLWFGSSLVPFQSSNDRLKNEIGNL